MEFQDILKQLRIEKNLTQEEFAKKIGYGYATVRYWESGVKKPSFDALIALSKFFNVPVGYIMGIED